MRIAFLSTGHPVYDKYPGGGGIQAQISGLAAEMSKKGHEVHVICRLADQPHEVASDATFHQLDGKTHNQIISMLAFSGRAAELIGSLEPDVISAFERFSAYFPSKGRHPLVFTAENYDAFRYYRRFAIRNQPLNLIIQPWKRRLEEGVMKRSDLVIALTKSGWKYLQSIGIDRVEIIPNGIRSGAYGNAEEEGYILYAGRLDGPKRVDLLLEAYAHLDHLREAFSLRVVGQGPEKPRLIHLATELGIQSQVSFEAWASQDRLRSLLSRCSAFVLPSDFETFGITMLEAMASSRAVVASNVPGPRDIITDQYDGLLFSPGDSRDLARILQVCLEDQGIRRALGRRARRTAARNYDFASVARRTLDAYSRIARA